MLGLKDLAEKQQHICQKYSSQYKPVAINEMVAVALQTLGKQPIYATRVILEEGENISWFIHCGEYSDAKDFYQPLHALHLVKELPQVLPYLALDHGYHFIIDNQGYEDVWFDGSEQEVT